ncbi:hypothetical protein AMATHDRAFT_143328, partial [Amanita thiersii Skay4041]
TRCGKHYLPHQPIVSPGGRFPVPRRSNRPLLAFRCGPRIKPYLLEDATTMVASVLVDTLATFLHMENTFSIDDAHVGKNNGVDVTVFAGDVVLGRGFVPFNVTNAEISINLGRLIPRRSPYKLTCTGMIDTTRKNSEAFTVNSSLWYLPTPYFGSVTKVDFKTKATLFKNKCGNSFETVFPIGFYTSFTGYLDVDLTILDEVKAQGFNIIHPVPPFNDLNVLSRVLDHMEDIGLYLMYDMRHTYRNSTQIGREVSLIQRRSNLLLWYTADEPDGHGDALEATRTAYDVVNSHDGYHPVSLALNCADYEFPAYAAGADIIMPDVYSIGNNVTFSAKYNTGCTSEFGCCGCDECKGGLNDVSIRLDVMHERVHALDWDKTKIVWSVTQAFGGEEFWVRPPTGREWLVQSVLSIIHGARGIIPWIDPAPLDIKKAASNLANALSSVKTYIFDPDVFFSREEVVAVDVGKWRLPTLTLIMMTSVTQENAVIELSALSGIKTIANMEWILGEGATIQDSKPDGVRTIVFEPLGTAIFLIHAAKMQAGRDEL